MSVAFFDSARITLCVFEIVFNPEMKSDKQVDSDAVEANANSSPTSSRPIVIVSELSGEARVKLEVIQSLIEPCDRTTYGERLREGAKKLGVSVRSVQRLFKKYQEEGLAALTSTTRGDKGKHRISEFWQDSIIKTYKEGNKGSKRMRSQINAIAS